MGKILLESEIETQKLKKNTFLSFSITRGGGRVKIF
jgi:hypothetical protein